MSINHCISHSSSVGRWVTFLHLNKHSISPSILGFNNTVVSVVFLRLLVNLKLIMTHNYTLAECIDIHIWYTSRSHIYYTEITACVFDCRIPNRLQFCLRVFPMLIRHLLRCSIACQLIQKNYCVICRITCYLFPNWPGKLSWRGVFPRKSQAAMFVFQR